MKIFAIGDLSRVLELEQKLKCKVYSGEPDDQTMISLQEYDVIFDLNSDDRPGLNNAYFTLQNKLLILCAVKKTLHEMTAGVNLIQSTITGMNALPTFINRSIIEICFANNSRSEKFMVFADEMKLNYRIVNDSVGMVTPRVISMIINEACFSLQERIASIEDIDKAMKLGTNYRFGPFEWCDHIGIKDVYETLDAIYRETQDRRYEICPLLKENYEKQDTFYH